MDLVGQVPIGVLCKHLDLPRSQWYRFKVGPTVQPSEPERRSTPPNALRPSEREHVRTTLNSLEYADQPIPQAYADLLEQGIYLASPSTMLKVL